jgi:hypothetical protein
MAVISRAQMPGWQDELREALRIDPVPRICRGMLVAGDGTRKGNPQEIAERSLGIRSRRGKLSNHRVLGLTTIN